MNKTTSYEKLIAAKLDEIPVPDMSDAIWSGIEAQLNEVVPSSQEVRMPKFKGKGLFVSAGACITATVMIFYFASRHQPKKTSPEKPLPPVQNNVTVTDTLFLADSVKKITFPTRPLKINKDTILLNEVQQNGTTGDSTSAAISLPEHQDSSHLESFLPAPVIDSGYQSPPPIRIKKPKGVKGITDEDYKISTKRDSSIERPSL